MKKNGNHEVTAPLYYYSHVIFMEEYGCTHTNTKEDYIFLYRSKK